MGIVFFLRNEEKLIALRNRRGKSCMMKTQALYCRVNIFNKERQ
jgi:hypothetical protein